MEWQFTPYAVPLFVGAFILLGIALYSLRRYATQGAMYLFWFCLLITFVVLGYAAEIGSTTVEDVLFWYKFEYIGFAPATAILLMLIVEYTGNQRYLTLLTRLFFLAIPAMTLAFAWTNQYHELMWEDLTLSTAYNFTGSTFTRGNWYWVNLSYNYLMVFAAVIVLVRAYKQTTGVYKRQYALLLFGIVLPTVAVIVRMVGIVGLEIDLSVYAFVISSGLFAFGIFEYQLFEVMPVAREAIITSMTDAVVVLDTENRVIELNSVARQLLEPGTESIIGRPVGDVFGQWADIIEKYQNVEQARSQISIDIPGDMGTPQRHFFDIQLSTLLSRGRNRGRLVVLRDVTERVKAETALTQNNVRLEAFRTVDAELSRKLDVHYIASMALDVALGMSMADAAFICLTEEGGIRIIHSLGEFERELVGGLISPDQGITSRVVRTHQAELVSDVLSDPDYLPIKAGTRAQITVPLLSGEDLIGVLTLESSKPEQFTPEVFETVKLMMNRVGSAIHNARLFEETENLVKELDAFAHTVAHDLKNPLAVIISYASLMNFDHPDGELGEFSNMIVNGAEKAVGIIDALLLLAGVRTMQTMEIVPLAMESIVNDVHFRVMNLIDEHRVKVVLPDSWLEAKGYAPWVEEIWANYFSNAIKYGGRPPCIEFGCNRLDDGQIRFWVKDNGKGLTVVEQGKLFRPFTRLAGQPNIEGHGLGLSIVQRIAERLNGTVGVESTLGEGSLFYFTLPPVN